jgi:hypothetical protein
VSTRPREEAFNVFMRSSRWWIIALLSVGATACGILELGGIGHVAETADVASPTGDDSSGRWTLPVVVDPASLEGVDVDVVSLAFDADDLACQDGAVIRPDAVAAGWSVTFERGDDPDAGLEAVDPPVIAVAEVRVACPDAEPSA